MNQLCGNSRCIPLLLAAILCSAIFGGPVCAQNNGLKKLVGEWELSKKINPDDKRSISFKIEHSQVTGTYIDSNGEPHTISEVVITKWGIAFRVRKLFLAFSDFKFVVDHFEGKMFITNVRLNGQPVLMVRKRAE